MTVLTGLFAQDCFEITLRTGLFGQDSIEMTVVTGLFGRDCSCIRCWLFPLQQTPISTSVAAANQPSTIQTLGQQTGLSTSSVMSFLSMMT